MNDREPLPLQDVSDILPDVAAESIPPNTPFPTPVAPIVMPTMVLTSQKLDSEGGTVW